MILSPQGREYYALTITTTPATQPTDWAASFDHGATWVTATAVDGNSAWLVAGASADPTGAVVVRTKTSPLVRLLDNPEIVVRSAPTIEIA